MVVHRTGRAQRDPRYRAGGVPRPPAIGCGSIVSVDLDQVPAELLEGLVVERYGTDFDVRMIASVGLAKAAWRNTEVEDAHAGNGLGRIHDGEMFAANVATTRLIHRHLNASSDIDWAGLANELVRPDRVAGARTVSDLLGELYDGWAEQSHALIETQRLRSGTRTALGPHVELLQGARNELVGHADLATHGRSIPRTGHRRTADPESAVEAGAARGTRRTRN